MPTVVDYLKYANLQMAAEAFLKDPTTGSEHYSGLDLEKALVRGNNRASLFTPTQAAEFADPVKGWTVVAQCPNTASGFSGTLFRNNQTGEQVISFRSTEFIDDAVNDCQTTNKTIKDFGWGFGQIADMEAWYASIQSQITGSLAVTGYSLGGHLATAFNLLHPGAASATYTYNGAGVGTVSGGTTLGQVMQDFTTVWANAGHNENLFTYQATKDLYTALATRQAGHIASQNICDMFPNASWLVSSVDVANAYDLAYSLASANASDRQTAQLLHDAVNRAYLAQQEYFRIQGYSSDGNGNGPVQEPDAMAKMQGLSVDYWLAVLTAARNTASTNTTAPYNRESGGLIDNFYDVVGKEYAGDTGSPSAVANSQLHYGETQSIFIESQPLYRGSFLSNAFVQSALYNDVKLLHEGFRYVDFGDTHSLVLLVDSLSVQNALYTLDNNLTVKTLLPILNAATNVTAQTLGSDQGKCEGDALEKLVDALGKIFGVYEKGDWVKLTPSLDGNTWWHTESSRPEASEGQTRDALYKNLALITRTPAYPTLAGKVTISLASADLASGARDQFSSLLSLLTLSPFVMKATTGNEAAVDAALQANWQTEYGAWQTDVERIALERAAGRGVPDDLNYSDTYLRDRAAMLGWLVKGNQENAASSGQTMSLTTTAVGVTDLWHFTDAQSTRTIEVIPNFPKALHTVYFGDGEGNSTVGGIDADHLYGGGGNDTLDGAKGNDYLEGNAGGDSLTGGEGRDTLYGGAGDDTLEGGKEGDVLGGGAGVDSYVFAAGDGWDWVEDSDGQGTLTYASVTLGQATIEWKAPNVWQEKAGGQTFTYSLYARAEGGETYPYLAIQGPDGGLWVKKWQDGQLGIHLNTDVPTRPLKSGTDDNDSLTTDMVGQELRGLGGTDTLRLDHDGTFALGGNGDDRLIGTADRLTLWGEDGNDNLTGAAGDDWLDGGTHNDALTGGEGSDILRGGTGSDVLAGGAGGDLLQGGEDMDILMGDNNAAIGLGPMPAIPPGSTLLAEGQWWRVIKTPSGAMQLLNISGDEAAGGSDQLDGGAGDDVVYAGGGDDYADGGDDNDQVQGMGGSDELYGGTGNDTVFGDGDYTEGWLNYTAFADHGNDRINGGDGDDRLIGQGGNDTLFGGEGADGLWGDDNDPALLGANHGADFLDGGNGDDQLFGGGAGDTVLGGAGNDILKGDADTLSAEWHGNDTLRGDAGADELHGQGGNDWLEGGTDDDGLLGGDGDDVLNGGTGQDYLAGGAGNDRYLLELGDGLRRGDAQSRYIYENIDDIEGNNTVVFGASVDRSNLVVRSGATDSVITPTGPRNDLVIDYGASDTVYVTNGALGAVQRYEFADGTSLSYTEFIGHYATGTMIIMDDQRHLTYLAGKGSQGSRSSNDYNTFSGGLGNDFFSGTGGFNTYLFSPGDGTDLIVQKDIWGKTNQIVFGAGITQDDVRRGTLGWTYNPLAYQYERTITIQVGNDLNDQIRIAGFSVDDPYNTFPIQSFVFSDGSSLSASQLLNRGLYGTALDDQITGTVVFERIYGLDGNDVIDGGGGPDTLIGGAGDDSYVVVHPGSVVVEELEGGTDSVSVGSSYTLPQNVENLILTGTTVANGTGNALDNVLTGNSAANVLVGGDGNDRLDGGSGSDKLYGGLGHDVYVVDNPYDTVTENADEGHDTVQSSISWTLGANVEDLTLIGASAIDGAGNERDNSVAGNAAANRLNGDAGDDTLNGRQGDDVLDGGVGNNTYLFSRGDGHDVINNAGQASGRFDVVALLGINPGDVRVERQTDGSLAVIVNDTGDSINLGLSNDPGRLVNQIRFADDSVWDQTYVLQQVANQPPVVRATIADQSALEDASFSFAVPHGTFTDPGDTLTLSASTSIGEPLPSWLSFNASTGVFTGTPGNENVGVIQLRVSATDAGGLVASTVFSLEVSNTNDAPVVTGTLANQSATEASAFIYTLPDGLFTDVDAGDSLRYSASLANGGALPSWLAFDSATKTFSGIPAFADAGDLTVKVSATDSAGAGAGQEFTLTINAVTGITLIGTAGNDTLTGTALNDTLDGGAGSDKLIGGAGNDVYLVDNSADVITEAANAGTDSVQSSVTYTLAVNVENLTLMGAAAINGVGNALDNVLIGNSANNTLNGNGGADTLMGGLGNDVYLVDNIGDVVIENAAEGTDVVQSSVTYFLGDNLENLTLTGMGANSGTGNALNNAITGNGAANILTGGLGNDTLNGGIGADTLVGGLGNDTYIVDNVGDVVIENPVEGTDLVQSSISHTLQADLENLTLTGSAAINGTGNALNNTITGNVGANILIGGEGNDALNGGVGIDTLIGGLGDDTYTVDNVSDVVTENAGEGTDLIQSSVSYVLAANVEKLTLTGTAAINGTGNALNNVLIGNSANNPLTGGDGNDTLDGGNGSDTMVGGLGNDTYVVNIGTDVVTEAANGGIDTVQSIVTLTLAANVEALVLAGAAAINGTGNALDNLLRGNGAANTLNGGAGNDLLQGGAGNDTLADTSGAALFDGGVGADTLMGGAGAEVFLGGAGNDTVTTAGGNDVICFNKGDGQDTFAAGGTGSDTLSLGGNFAYSDLTLAKSSNDLVLKMGATDQITFKNWYAATPSKPVVNLQVIAEAMAGFDAGGADPLRDQKVENFNFSGLVGAFDAARAADANLTSWALSNALATTNLGGSDTAAIGGDLAYQYGKNGTLAGIGLTAAQEVIGASGFGTQSQTLRPLESLQTGSVRLS